MFKGTNGEFVPLILSDSNLNSYTVQDISGQRASSAPKGIY